MKKLSIAVLKGDGIGPEVTDEAIKVLQAIAKKFGHQFTFEEALVGAAAIFESGEPLPAETLSVCKNNDAVLFGAIGHPDFDNNPAAKVRPEQGLLKLRKELNLFLNIRPIKAYDALLLHSPLKEAIVKNVDFKIYRELTGGIYFGEKKLSEDGLLASDLCSYTVIEIERVTQLAFKAAQKSKNKVTLVDKANVLETSRLWRKVVQQVAAQYPEVSYETLFVDNAAMQIILNPKQFDIMLTANLFGDVLSDEASVIAGSLGLLPSASVGDQYAMFEPVHGSYYAAKGKGIANPMAAILSAAMLLQHFSLTEEAHTIELAVNTALNKNKVTEDIAPDKPSTTAEVGDYIALSIEQM